MLLPHRPLLILSLLLTPLVLFGGIGHAGVNCENQTFNFSHAENEHDYVVIKNDLLQEQDSKAISLKSELTNKKIQFLNLTEKTSGASYDLIDIKGTSGFNKIACEAYMKWKTLITLTPQMPKDIGGAFDGFNELTIKGHLHLSSLEENILYHELIHAFLSYGDYQNNPSPLSAYYIRDRELDKKDFAYANYLSGQEIAAFTFQALLYPERRHENLDYLLNIANFAKELALDDSGAKAVLFKFHKGLKMAGLKLQTGEIYFPTETKQLMSESELRKTLIKKFETFLSINKKIDTLLNAATKPTEFEYAGVSLKENLGEDMEQKYLEQIRKEIFSEALKPEGYLAEFMKWTNTFWVVHFNNAFEKKRTNPSPAER